MNGVVRYFRESYRLSPFAFYCEFFETLFLVSASAVLTWTVLDPATEIFIPMYLIGSILGLISTVIRKAAFTIFLCSWFVVMNTIALIQIVVN